MKGYYLKVSGHANREKMSSLNSIKYGRKISNLRRRTDYRFKEGVFQITDGFIVRIYKDSHYRTVCKCNTEQEAIEEFNNLKMNE